ncbi:secretion protein HlyD family protein [Desulfovibrio sp. X2]|uniref:secretion protein HlyD n=1 Tax=Desulfovibrio sp. X2 TaxID=941449 RepID=UPI000358F020|nr:secretion protein HlyD [Desulfovibrio sp. X2]EPR43427.1 secretion protein HlyD family protein [Desulfovibrio sp. X2]
MKAKKFLFLVLVLAVAGGLWWTLGRRAEEANGRLRLYGNVDIRQVELSFRVGGRLEELRVDEGDPVKPGMVVARLDAQPYRDALNQALGQRDVAAADLDKLRTGYRTEDVAQARALVAQREATVENNVRLARRREALVKSGAISEQEYDDAVTQRDESQAQLDQARKALELLVHGYRSEDISASEANMRAAEAAVASAMTNLADTEIIAPSKGTVLSRVREPGAVVSPGDTVIVVSLASPVWVRAYVSEPDLGRVHPGMKFLVTTDSRPDKPYVGHVGFISPVAEFTPKNVETEKLRTDLVYRLRIIVDHPDEGLRQGMPVTVTEPADQDGKDRQTDDKDTTQAAPQASDQNASQAGEQAAGQPAAQPAPQAAPAAPRDKAAQ